MPFFKYITFLFAILIATGCRTGDSSKPELIEIEMAEPFMDFESLSSVSDGLVYKFNL